MALSPALPANFTAPPSQVRLLFPNVFVSCSLTRRCSESSEFPLFVAGARTPDSDSGRAHRVLHSPGRPYERTGPLAAPPPLSPEIREPVQRFVAGLSPRAVTGRVALKDLLQ
jgi:hypothetical protein